MTSPSKLDEPSIGEGLMDVARAIRLLGNADACTPMGGLEALGAVLLKGAEMISDSLDYLRAVNDVADGIGAVASSLDRIATLLSLKIEP